MKPERDLSLQGLIHDLNNVFQTLVGAADVLSGDPHWTELSNSILRSVELGKRIASGMYSVDGPAAAFEEILDDAVAFVEDMRRVSRGPAIAFDLDVDPGIVFRRKWAWERVLVNLFLNATQAMPQGGTIRVRALLRAGEVQIAIQDEGCGISPEVLDRLFRPRVSTKSSEGLGLHVVETIVAEEGGSVTAANRENGRGAEFTIFVPNGVFGEERTSSATA